MKTSMTEQTEMPETADKTKTPARCRLGMGGGVLCAKAQHGLCRVAA